MRILTLYFLLQIISFTLFAQVELTFTNLEAGDTKNINSHEPIFQTPDGNFLRLRDYKTGETSAKDKIIMQKLDASGKLLASTPWQLTASGESFIAHCGVIKFKDKILMIIRRDKRKSSTFQILEIVDHNQIEERILIDDLPAYYSPLHGDFYGVKISPNQKYLLLISSCGGRYTVLDENLEIKQDLMAIPRDKFDEGSPVGFDNAVITNEGVVLYSIYLIQANHSLLNIPDNASWVFGKFSINSDEIEFKTPTMAETPTRIVIGASTMTCREETQEAFYLYGTRITTINLKNFDIKPGNIVIKEPDLTKESNLRAPSYAFIDFHCFDNGNFGLLRAKSAEVKEPTTFSAYYDYTLFNSTGEVISRIYPTGILFFKVKNYYLDFDPEIIPKAFTHYTFNKNEFGFLASLNSQEIKLVTATETKIEKYIEADKNDIRSWYLLSMDMNGKLTTQKLDSAETKIKRELIYNTPLPSYKFIDQGNLIYKITQDKKEFQHSISKLP